MGLTLVILPSLCILVPSGQPSPCRVGVSCYNIKTKCIKKGIDIKTLMQEHVDMNLFMLLVQI